MGPEAKEESLTVMGNLAGGLIYCSAITARLVTTIIGVKPEYVKALPMEEVSCQA